MKKKIIFIVAALFLLFSKAYAGEGDIFVFGQAGVMYRNTANVLVGFEFEKKYFSAFELYADVSRYFESRKTFPVGYSTYSVGFAYKPAFYRTKNTNARFRFGADIGFNQGYTFYSSLDLGIELSYSFKNRMQIVLSQKNDFAFWSLENFKNGVLIGLKIPLY